MSTSAPDLPLLVPDKWDRRFFDLCRLIASWSEDRDRHVGCVIVGPANEIRSTGFNGFARRVRGDVERRHYRPDGEKFFWSEHAERNTIYNAARVGIPVDGCRAYVNVFPCADCMRSFIQSGIRQVNSFPIPPNDQYFARSFTASLDMANEAGLEIRFFDPA